MADASSPIPLIGLYIAGATVVVFLSMLYDTIVGFRSKRPWLPCKLFKLNSLTFAILAIVTKLPVDLTTSMPRAQDQLSKLTSTTLICVSMGFFMPSIGNMSESELFSNMAALFLFVITVIINVFIQIKTGVIFSFQVEHVIILCIMFLLLLVLWSCSKIRVDKLYYRDEIRDILTEAEGYEVQGPNTMLQRLKFCYMKSYYSSPQLGICLTAHYATIGALCFLSCMIMIQSLIRTALTYKDWDEFKSKQEVLNSDYGWSVLAIVLAQILTVLLGTFTVSFRLITIMIQTAPETLEGAFMAVISYSLHKILFGKLFSLPQMFISSTRFGVTTKLQRFEDLVGIVLFGVHKGVLWINLLIVLPVYVLRQISRRQNSKIATAVYITEEMDQYKSVLKQSTHTNLEEWVIKLGSKDIERWMARSKTDTPTSLIRYIQERRMPPTSGGSLEFLGYYDDVILNRNCFLSMVILVMTTRFVLSSKELFDDADICFVYGESFLRVLEEGFEIIHFVDGKLNPGEDINATNKLSMLAKDLWLRRDIKNHWLQTDVFGPALEASLESRELCTVDDYLSESSKIDCIIGMMGNLSIGGNRIVRSELRFLNDYEFRLMYKYVKDNRGAFKKVEDLFEHIQKLLVEMLHYHLSQLPLAIFKDVAEAGPFDECEERVQLALSFLYKLEPLECHVEWRFPEECKFTRLIMPAATPTPDDATNISNDIENESFERESVDDKV